MSIRSYRLAELTSPEIGAAIAGGLDTVIIPVGSTEQHGTHLPMGTDSLHTVAVLERVAERLGALVTPLMPVGRADHHMAFPGSMTVRHETLHAVIRDWCDSLFRHGFRRVLIYSGHGGNAVPLARIIGDLSAENPDREIIGCTDWRVYDDALFPAAAAEGVGIEAAGWHAGELEASMILALAPDQVLMERAAPGFLGRLDDVRDVLMAEGLQAVAPSGVLGDPRGATRAHGEKYLAALTDAVARHFQAAIAARAAMQKSKSRETDA